MSTRIERRSAQREARLLSLADLLHEGFYLLHLLKQRHAPGELEDFQPRIVRMLDDFEKEARRLHAHGDDIEAAQYAYCAALDEIVLSSDFGLRGAWERTPLQLTVFGDQLAGKHFFDKLEALRGKGAVRLQALQVFHMCLLMGFKGRYAMDDRDRLAWITARLGDEIAHIKGKGRGFAPQAARPDQVAHQLRRDVPPWLLALLLVLTAASAYGAMQWSLLRESRQRMAVHANVVQLPPQPASLTITLP
ncbi:DotU family type IV/VI secretion system protein [Duganella sp. FT92W]|uniref:DotU family type IV/VI secretion system protein n=1 Tax=Pseudoduganella rivuli TaxID=2666085 RepID=A0A7X2IT66_9BURK|nr:type IVB secretion system protein IcmH/DotU [Pseudoduganella rivuli]MRV75594.1 DotU family type IV/VI secretion system protein [Pseudoduganella rivuli]